MSDDARPSAATLVVELVTEELPPKALKTLGAAFAETLVAQLRARAMLGADSTITPFATPRRLAVAITGVRSVAPDAPEIVTVCLMANRPPAGTMAGVAVVPAASTP